MEFSTFNNFDFMFGFVPVMIGLIFIAMLIIFIIIAIKGVRQWSKNNNSPVLAVDVKVVAKRTSTSGGTHHHGDMVGYHTSTSTSTSYYVTFEVESGDRMELYVPDTEYGMIAEGDVGKLTFQGTRYKGFERLKY